MSIHLAQYNEQTNLLELFPFSIQIGESVFSDQLSIDRFEILDWLKAQELKSYLSYGEEADFMIRNGWKEIRFKDPGMAAVFRLKFEGKA